MLKNLNKITLKLVHFDILFFQPSVQLYQMGQQLLIC